MKVTANIATYPKRHEQLKKMLPTILDQFDEIRVCLNEYDQAPQFLKHDKITVAIPPVNLTDNGKFMFIEIADKDELYCTLDDDILYPKNYRKTLEEAHKRYPEAILTFHGRKLNGKFKKYYKAGHTAYRCLGRVTQDVSIDVAGTGVSAFVPFKGCEDIALFKQQKMSDIVFSLQAAYQKKEIICLRHKQGWIKNIESDVSIYQDEVKSDVRQAYFCNLIYEIKYG